MFISPTVSIYYSSAVFSEKRNKAHILHIRYGIFSVVSVGTCVGWIKYILFQIGNSEPSHHLRVNKISLVGRTIYSGFVTAYILAYFLAYFIIVLAKHCCSLSKPSNPKVKTLINRLIRHIFLLRWGYFLSSPLPPLSSSL